VNSPTTSTHRGGQRRPCTRATIGVDGKSALVFHDVVRCQTGSLVLTAALTFVALASGCHKETTTAAPTDGQCDGARCVEMAEAAMYYKDYADAREPLALVCDNKDGFACYRLAELYQFGRGGAVDLDKARTHFTKACEFNVKDGCDAVKQLDAAKGQNVDLELTTTVAQLALDGLETRNLSCRMTEYGLPALDKVLASVARHKSTLDACAVDGAAVGISFEFERGKVREARIKGKTPGKISKCVKDVLKKLRLGNEGKCEAVLLLGNPENAAKGFAARLEAAAQKGDGLNHIHVSEDD